MAYLSLLPLLNAYATATDAEKARRQTEFFKLLKQIDKNPHTLAQAPQYALNEQQQAQFLRLFRDTLSITLSNTRKKTWRADVRMCLLTVCSNFLATSTSAELVKNYENDDVPNFWLNIFSDKIFPTRELATAKRKNIGLFGYYLAIKYECPDIARCWDRLGSNPKDLPEADRNELLKVALRKKDSKYSLFLRNFLLRGRQRLTQVKEAMLSAGENAAHISMEVMSPFRSQLEPSLQMDTPVKKTEKYPRSSEHFAQQHGRKEEGKRFKIEGINYGISSHLGDSNNPIQQFGDKEKFVDGHRDTTPGDGILRDAMLNYQHAYAIQVINYVHELEKLSTVALKYVKPGVYNGYPCIMVYCPKERLRASFGNTRSNDTFDTVSEVWTSIAVSLFTGLVNAMAFKFKLPVEILRRSSFGFLRPTVSPTAASFRINIGLIPKIYSDVLAVALALFDRSMDNLLSNPAAIPEDAFVNKDFYREYLGAGDREIFNARNLLQLLLAKAEKGAGGKTTLQTIERTPHARQAISSKVFSSLFDQEINPALTTTSFIEALQWATTQLKPSKAVVDNKTHLGFDQSEDAVYPAVFELMEESLLIDDPFFLVTAKAMVERFRAQAGDDGYLQEEITALEEIINTRKLDGFYHQLDMVFEYFYLKSVREKKQHISGDAYGSDSEAEAEIAGRKFFAKKITVHNGMRAILATLLAVKKYRVSQAGQTADERKILVHCSNAYYEVLDGILLTEKYQKTEGTMQITKAQASADVIIYDLNACVVDGKAIDDVERELKTTKGKLIIFDATSATTHRCHEFLKWVAEHGRSHTVFFVASELKHGQLGSDKNHVGTIRIFSMEKPRRDDFYRYIKEFEGPVQSPVSHAYRRLCKAMGTVITNAEILNPSIRP